MTLARIFPSLSPLLLALALVAPGCGSDSTRPSDFANSQLTQNEANDVAAQTGFALDFVGLDVRGAGELFSSPDLLSTRLRLRSARPMQVAWDTTLVIGGLQAEISANLYDAGGNLLTEFGPTAYRLNWRSHLWGDIEAWRDTAAIRHHANFDFTGLQAADTALLLNGAATDTMLVTFRTLDSLTVHHAYWRSALDIADIVVRKADGQPLSGTITYQVRVDVLNSNSTTDVVKHLNATVVITFNGTSQPDVVINGSYHYRWNMELGTMTPA